MSLLLIASVIIGVLLLFATVLLRNKIPRAAFYFCVIFLIFLLILEVVSLFTLKV